MSSNDPFQSQDNQESAEGLMREQMVRLHYLFRGEPCPEPMPERVDSASRSPLSSLRAEMLEELERLKAILRSENSTGTSLEIDGDALLEEGACLEGTEDASPEEVREDPGEENGFRSLRDEMLQELMRLQQIMGHSSHDEEKSLLSGFEAISTSPSEG